MIIGCSFAAQVGKDTVGEILCRSHGFKRLAFADKLKELAMDIDPMILANSTVNVNVGGGRLKKAVERAGWDTAKKQYKEIRPFLQRLGVAVRKHFGADIWVDAVLKQITDETTNIVVTDVRYPNEAEAIQLMGGFIIRIDRPNRPQLPSGDDHDSEHAMDGFEGWDYIILNNGSLEALDDIVEDMLNKLKTPKVSSEAQVS